MPRRVDYPARFAFYREAAFSASTPAALSPAGPPAQPVWTAVRQHVEDREIELGVVIGAVVPGAAALARGLVDGLTWGLCVGRIDPAEAARTARDLLTPFATEADPRRSDPSHTRLA